MGEVWKAKDLILGRIVAIKVLAPGYYARHDMRSPMRIAVCVLVLTQLLNLVLVPVLQHAALTLTIALGAMVNALWLLIGLMRRGSYRPEPGWGRFVLKVIVASAVLGLLFYGFIKRVLFESPTVICVSLIIGGVVLLVLERFAPKARHTDAMKLSWKHLRVVIEPSCAVPLAIVLKNRDVFAGKRVGIIITGGNVDLDKLPWI